MELSKRLQAVADLLDSHETIADIGCDHGFVSIYLINTKKAKKCIAMDVNQGPIEKAKEHIGEEGLNTYIETRISDGAKELKFLEEGGGERKLEAEAAILAGMGGRLTIRIIEESLEKFLAMKEFILQPQSEIWKVREYVEQIGCRIAKENMIMEEGKFYPILKVVTSLYDGDLLLDDREVSLDEKEIFYHYGEDLLRNHNEILHDFLMNEKRVWEEILEELKEKNTSKTESRKKELEEKLNMTIQGLEWFEDDL